MKIRDLFEAKLTPVKVCRWVLKHWDKDYNATKPTPEDFVITPDGKVIANGHVCLDLKHTVELPFEFEESTHEFSLYHPKSLKGSPRIVRAYDVIGDISSLEGFPQIAKSGSAKSRITLDIPSLKDIHKHLKNAHSILLTRHVKSNVLGLILVETGRNIETVVSGNNEKPDDTVTPQLRQVVSILNKYRNQGQQGVVKAQRELLEADLDDYAEL